MRTIGQKIGQWLTNIKLLIPLLAMLGFGTAYNAPQVKEFIHGKTEVVITEGSEAVVVEDPVTKEIIELGKKRDARMDRMQSQINQLKAWHE